MGKLIYNSCQYNFKVSNICFPTSLENLSFGSIYIGLEITFENNKKIIWIKVGLINPNQTYEDCFEIIYLGRHWIVEIEHMMEISSYPNMDWITPKNKYGIDINVENFGYLKKYMPQPVFWALWGLLMENGSDNLFDQTLY